MTSWRGTAKVGVVGTGAVGRACALALMQRGSCRELILVDQDHEAAAGVATDMRYARAVSPPVEVSDGDYAKLSGSDLVLITAGVNEQSGGATDPDDPLGRLRLLDDNADVYRDVIPQVVNAAPEAVLLVVTDPPDPLTDLARELAGHDRVFGAGTLIDSLRLRFHLGQRLGVAPRSVHASVAGEHGKSSVTLWSSATVGGVPVDEFLSQRADDPETLRSAIEEDVSNANLTIIQGIGASQFGIGVVSARLTEAVLDDERVVLPVGSLQQRYGLALSLPSVLGRQGVVRTLWPPMSAREREKLDHSAEVLRTALAGI